MNEPCSSICKYGAQSKIEELAYILIGPTRVENYHLPVSHSVDNLRFRLRLPSNRYDEMCKRMDTYPSDSMYSSASKKLGGFRAWWVFEGEKSSVNVGLGWNSPSGKVHSDQGYIEFNPNKVYDLGKSLLHELRSLGCEADLVRWDLALDYLFPRSWIRCVKDSRNYEIYIGKSVTEYLGVRSRPGRVKVYDKQAEAALAFPLTRVELTCDASWDVEQIIKQLPVCYSFYDVNISNLKNTTMVLGQALQMLDYYGGNTECLLKQIERHTRCKIRKAFKSSQVLKYNPVRIQQVIEEARSW